MPGQPWTWLCCPEQRQGVGEGRAGQQWGACAHTSGLLTSRQPLIFTTVPNGPAEPQGAFPSLICLALPSLETWHSLLGLGNAVGGSGEVQALIQGQLATSCFSPSFYLSLSLSPTMKAPVTLLSASYKLIMCFPSLSPPLYTALNRLIICLLGKLRLRLTCAA